MTTGAGGVVDDMGASTSPPLDSREMKVEMVDTIEELEKVDPIEESGLNIVDEEDNEREGNRLVSTMKGEDMGKKGIGKKKGTRKEEKRSCQTIEDVQQTLKVDENAKMSAQMVYGEL
ncbi:hypothetical protein SUGI_0443200 [Cryptomeria japonica]|nr:hypothetical protein SUGI_0443200 [Cryptomeria japonica]